MQRFRCITLVFVVVFLTACNEKMELHTKLSEADANEIVAALMDKGIPARKAKKRSMADQVYP